VRAREQVLQRGAEVFQVDGLVRRDEELRQRELTLAEDPERRRHRFARVAVAHDGTGERVIAGLAVRPQIPHAWHDEREQRRQELLQEVADVEVLLSRLANDRGRVDRVPAPGELSDMEDRVVVAQRVIAVVIAERPLRLALA
jgi:hypothetical protein